jgi:site-specific DNA-methyltransferase (adenine-specific)
VAKKYGDITHLRVPQVAAVYNGDCLEVIRERNIQGVDLIYLDPPFGTQKDHSLSTRDGNTLFSYSDRWDSKNEYSQFIRSRISLFKQILKPTGSLFFHCDSTSSHIAHLILDEVFGEENFRSEIIWHYKRWTNSQKNLIPAHQTIFFYSRSADFKFNPAFSDYSETTNVDQILHRRERDWRGKSAYAIDEDGDYIINGAKRGVPLSDVWEIPFLNPKAKERVGYPTQKPITLLERIINLASDPGDLVLDPFCGSGTTLVAASLLGRRSIGIDISESACNLAATRLENPVKTESVVLNIGRGSYLHKAADALKHLAGLDYTVIPRNKGIDAILKKELNGRLVFVRVQREFETLDETIAAITKGTERKGSCYRVVVKTAPGNEGQAGFEGLSETRNLLIISSFSDQINQALAGPESSPGRLVRKMPASPAKQAAPGLVQPQAAAFEPPA